MLLSHLEVVLPEFPCGLTTIPTPLQNCNGGGHATALTDAAKMLKSIANIVTMKTKGIEIDIAASGFIAGVLSLTFRNIFIFYLKKGFKG